MHFKTVYEIGRLSDLLADCLYIFMCIFFILLGLAMYLYAKYYIEDYSVQLKRKQLASKFMVFGAAVIPFVGFGVYSSYTRRYNAYQHKKYEVIEGNIKSLRDSTRLKNTSIRLFSVDTVQFEVDLGRGGYDRIWESIDNYPDSVVRITYLPTGTVKRDILKFESAE
jgi:hypothetical protein